LNHKIAATEGLWFQFVNGKLIVIAHEIGETETGRFIVMEFSDCAKRKMSR